MGIKRYTVHYGPVSPRAINGPTVTKGLIWIEMSWAIHGPEVKTGWIILDGPDDATGPNSDRP